MGKSMVLLGACLLAGCTSFSATPGVMGNPTWGTNCYPDMKLDVQNIVATPIADCGYASLEASPALREKVKSCAKDAVQSGQPFVFGYQENATSMWSCNVAVRDADSQLWYIYLDNDVMDAHSRNPGHTRWSISRCNGPLEIDGEGNASSRFFDLKGCTMDMDQMARLRTLRPHPHGIADPP